MPLEWQSQKVLVTGGSGVIGRALVAQLEGLGCESLVSISSAEVDLKNTQQTSAFFASVKPDVVFHLAAKVSGIMGNRRDRASAFTDNARINLNVIDATVEAGAKKIVAMGTTAIYSDDIALPMKEEDLWYGPPHSSEAPYGHAKRAMLAQLEAYAEQYGLDFAYCISTNLYGPHDRFDEGFGHVLPSLVSKFHRAATSDYRVEVWGNGQATRDFLFSSDAAKALILAAEQGHGAMNIASGQTVSIRQVAELLAEVTGYSHPILWDETKPNGQLLRSYDVSKLEALGYRAETSLRSGLEQTYDWYSANYPNVRR